MKPGLRTVFFGTPDFAVPSLRACAESSTLLALVSQPDKPKGRGQSLESTPTKKFAETLNLKVFQPESLKKPNASKDAFFEFVKKEKPDLFVVTAYGNLLPQEVLSLPQLFCVNVHASLLPKWRGAAPIQRALEAGDSMTGIALQQMVLALDAGPILAEEKLPIDNSWGAKKLTEELSLMGAQVLANFLKADAQAAARPQDESQMSLAKKISKDEGLWQASWTAQESVQKSKAFEVWPGLRLPWSQGELKIKGLLKREDPENPPDCAPGTLVLHARTKKVYLKCNIRPGEQRNSGFVLIESLQPPNQAAIDAARLLENPSPGFVEQARQGGLRLLKI